jgi:UDP-glucose 4-epimerase
MRILVTGGAGYVGSVSVARLAEAGHGVVVVDDLTTGHRGAVPAEATFVAMSYADGEAIATLLERERIDAVLHCAARSLVGESIANPAKYYRDNVAGGIALLEAMRRVGTGRLVFSSTAAVYGTPDSTPITEEAPLRPINPYGETKRTFEGALGWYAAAYGLRSVSLRYFNVAGATERIGEIHNPETHLIPTILRAAEGRIDLTIYGNDYPTRDGTNIRDYIDVSDLADAHLLALEATDPSDARTGNAGEPARAPAFNLGNGDGFSVLDVLAAAERVVGRPIPHAFGPRRPGDPPILVASAARAAETLGWRPQRPSLDEMIGSAWSWRRRHPDGYAD